MKKLSFHLSLLCLLAVLLIPFVGCKKDEPAEDENNAAVTSDTTMSTSTTTETSTSMGTDTGAMGTDMGTGSTMGTDMTTSSPMGSDTAKPPAGK
jgi:hypothetical protein